MFSINLEPLAISNAWTPICSELCKPWFLDVHGYPLDFLRSISVSIMKVNITGFRNFFVISLEEVGSILGGKLLKGLGVCHSLQFRSVCFLVLFSCFQEI